MRSLLAPDQPRPLDLLHTFFKLLASVLQYAPDRGIIQLAIKPENLLLDDQQQIQRSDFELDLLASTLEQLQTRELIGAIFSMSSEQLHAKPCFATDQARYPLERAFDIRLSRLQRPPWSYAFERFSHVSHPVEPGAQRGRKRR